MIIYIQWSLADPSDWFPIDISRLNHIRNLPRKGDPTGQSVALDNAPGWLCGINCQGIDFSGYDHVALEVVTDGIRITGIVDADPTGEKWATEWTLLEPAPDDRLGGAMNTRQSRRVWATAEAVGWFPGVAVLPWAEFVYPPDNVTFHGVWMSDELFMRHKEVRTPHGWREWTP